MSKVHIECGKPSNKVHLGAIFYITKNLLFEPECVDFFISIEYINHAHQPCKFSWNMLTFFYRLNMHSAHYYMNVGYLCQ